MIRRHPISVTTIADGTATAYSPRFSGFIHSIQYVKDTFVDGVDFTITLENTGETLWAQADVNAGVTKAPRQPTHTTAGVANLYAAGGTAINDLIAASRDRAKVVIAQGGNVTHGTFYVVVHE